MERATHALIRRLSQKKRFDEALYVAATMLKAYPQDLTAWHLLGAMLLEMGRTAEAAHALASVSQAFGRAGDLPMAIFAAQQCGKAGGPRKSLLKDLAEEFSAACTSLVDELDVSPPPMPPRIEVELKKAKNADLEAEVDTAIALAESASDSSEPANCRFFPLFSALSPEAFVRLATILSPRTVEPKQEVMAQGAPGDGFSIIAKGEVRVEREAKGGTSALLARLGAGGFFGEMAIVARAPRAASVQTADHVLLLDVDMDTLNPLTAETPEIKEVLSAFCRARMLENVVLASTILRRVPVAERPQILQSFQEKVHEAKAEIIKEGSESEGLHLIVSGEVEVTRDEDGETLHLARLGPGDLFGEISLVLRRPATATVTAASESLTLALPREAFLEVINTHPQLLSELYKTAVEREEETASILAREALDADDLILV